MISWQRLSFVRIAWQDLCRGGTPLLRKSESYLRKLFPQRGQESLLLVHFNIWLVILYARPTFFATIIGAMVSGLGWAIFLWSEGYAYHAAERLPCGPFRYSRHPYLFIGFLVILGLCLASRAFIPLVVLLSVGGLWVQLGMRVRDGGQTSMPQQEFLRYRLYTASFLPTLLPYTSREGEPTFSVKRAFFAAHHRAVKWLLLLVVLYCALFIYPSLPHASWWQWGSALVYGLWVIKYFFFHDLGHKVHHGQGTL